MVSFSPDLPINALSEGVLPRKAYSFNPSLYPKVFNPSLYPKVCHVRSTPCSWIGAGLRLIECGVPMVLPEARCPLILGPEPSSLEVFSAEAVELHCSAHLSKRSRAQHASQPNPDQQSCLAGSKKHLGLNATGALQLSKTGLRQVLTHTYHLAPASPTSHLFLNHPHLTRSLNVCVY